MASAASNILNLLTGGSGKVKEREDFEGATVDPATGEIVGGRDRFTQSKIGSFLARLSGDDTARSKNIEQNDLLQQMQLQSMLSRSNNTQSNQFADARQAKRNKFTAGQGVIDTQNRKDAAENLASTNADAARELEQNRVGAAITDRFENRADTALAVETDKNVAEALANTNAASKQTGFTNSEQAAESAAIRAIMVDTAQELNLTPEQLEHPAFQQLLQDRAIASVRGDTAGFDLGRTKSLAEIPGAGDLVRANQDAEQALAEDKVEGLATKKFFGDTPVDVGDNKFPLRILLDNPALPNVGSANQSLPMGIRMEQALSNIRSNKTSSDLNILRGLDMEDMIEVVRKEGEPTVGERLERRGRGRGTGLASARLPVPSRLDITQGNLGVTPNPDAGLPDGTVIGQGGNQAIIINGETVPLAEWKAFQESRR